MKKALLMLIFIVLVVFFIAFNYLLWDRVEVEKTVELSAQRNAYKIDDLNAEIVGLKKFNKQLDDKLKQEIQEKDAITQQKDGLDKEKQALEKQVQYRDKLVSFLKQSADLSSAQGIIKDWAENINKSQYKQAYDLMSSGGASYNDFENQYKASVKSIKIKLVKLNTDINSPENENDFIFDVTADIKINDEKTNQLFISGENKCNFKMMYDVNLNKWFIESITVVE